MPQGVFLSEQTGLPCVLRLCFKQGVCLKKRPVVTSQTGRCCECISHHPKDAGGGGGRERGD